MLSESNIYNALAADSLILDPMLVAKAMLDGKDGKAVMTDEIASAVHYDVYQQP